MDNQQKTDRGLLARIQRFFVPLSRDHTSDTEVDNISIYQHLVEASPSGMILVDAQQPDLPIIRVNEAFVKSTGYTAREVVGKNCRFLQGTDRDQPERKAIRHALDHQHPCMVTLRNYRKDGSMFWNELRIAPIRNERGVVTYFIGIQNDVTERKQIEQALQQSERRYRQMFQNNRAIQLLIDPETGNIVQANQAAADFYGYDIETLQNMRIHEINMLSEDEVHSEMRLAVAQEQTFFEFQHRLASGEIRNVNVFSSPIDATGRKLLYSIVVDVDEKQKTQRLYESLFQQSNDAVFMLSMEGRLVYANQRATDILGYEAEEIIGLSYKDLVIPEEHNLSDNVLGRMLAGETIPPYERTFRRKDGVHIPAEVNVEIVRDTDGTPLYIQSIVRDITERKQMENTLREKEHRFRSFVEHSSDGVVMVDAEGRIIEWNQSMEALTNIPTEEARGQYLWDIQYKLALESLRTPLVYEQVKQMVHQLLETGDAPWLHTPQDTVIVSAGGSHHMVQAVMFPIPVERGFQVGSILRDISEQKRFENALRESESRLRAMIEAIPDTIFRNRVDGTYLDWHAPDKGLLVASPDDFLGNKIQDTLPEPIASEQMAAIRRAIETGHVATHEFTVPLADGERHFEVRIMPSGEDEVVSIARDVTDIRQAQQRALELSLEKERLRLLTAFIQNAAHEFRTPLAAISTSAYLMARSDDPIRRTEKMQRIEGHINEITNLVDVLTLMVQLENPEALSLLPTDFRAIVQFVCQELSTEGKAKPVLVCELEGKIPEVMADVVYMSNAIHQVIENAIRFTPQDGTVKVTMWGTNEATWLQVEDTGVGIAKEDLPNIFQTFWRKDKAHTTRGFGLGLPIAQKIIEQHGGDLFVESKVGHGTNVRIRLPLITEKKDKQPSAIDS